jgi:hypothetical protein
LRVAVPRAPGQRRRIPRTRPRTDTHWKNLDPEIHVRIAQHDPGNKHAVDYMWGTAIYPPPAVTFKLFPDLAESEQFSRLLNRSWTRFVTGKRSRVDVEPLCKGGRVVKFLPRIKRLGFAGQCRLN